MTSLVYLDGTASVSTGSALVTGHGTAWKIALVEGGSFSLAGLSVPILSVDSDTSLTLAYDWPGDTLEEARYAIARETSQAIRAAWINDRLAQFHQKPWGIGVLPDGRGTLAERNALNPMPFDNYCWLRVEVDQPAELYFKVPAGWLGPFRLSGEVGPVGPAGVLRWRTEGWNNTASYQVNDGLAHNGTSYRAYVAHEASPATQPGVGANWADFWQVTAQGTILIEGTTTTLPPDQPARVEFRPVPGGYAVDFFVPRGSTGDIDGVTPFWVTRLSTDADAEAARAGLGATEIGDALFMAEDAAAARIAMEVYSRTESGFLSGFRDKIINGGFDIAQLGPSVTVTGNTPKYTLDMWLVACTTGISCTAQRVRNEPGSPLGRHRGRFTFAGTGAASSRVDTRIEGVDAITGKATLSFFAADNVATSVTIQVVQNFGTGGSAPVASSYGSVPIGSNILEGYQTIVIDIPSVSGKIIGPNNDDYLEIRFYQNVPNAHVFELASVRIVQGDATAEVAPFAPLHIQQLISLCQRYFEKSYDLDVAPGTMTANGAMRWQLSSTSANMYPSATRFAVVKRSIPAMTIWNPTTGASNSLNADTNNTAIGVSSLVGTSSVSTGAIAAAAAGVVGYQYAAHFTADSRL